jgi:hypothetical protein
MRVGLVVAVAMMVAGCGGPSTATEAPTEAPPTQASSTPASTSAAPPTEAPTEVPTEPPPTAEPTAATSIESVDFNWAPGSVPPSDADDVAVIAVDLMENDGIVTVTGTETVLNVSYDPARITVEEIMALLQQMGHPVVVNE